MTAPRCSSCHRLVIAAWELDGTTDLICLRCIRDALDLASSMTLSELLDRLREEKR